MLCTATGAPPPTGTVRTVSQKAMNYMSMAGMALFLGFFVIMLNQDIQRFGLGRRRGIEQARHRLHHHADVHEAGLQRLQHRGVNRGDLAGLGVGHLKAYETLEELVEWGSVVGPQKADQFNTYRAPRRAGKTEHELGHANAERASRQKVAALVDEHEEADGDDGAHGGRRVTRPQHLPSPPEIVRHARQRRAPSRSGLRFRRSCEGAHTSMMRISTH